MIQGKSMGQIDQVIRKIKENKVYRIVFYGDSITSAEWVHPNYRDIVEYVLKEAVNAKAKDLTTGSWGVRCINSGFDGASTKDLLEMLDDQVLFYKPDMVVVMATSNDIYANINPQGHVDNIKQIVDKLLKQADTVVYSTDIASKNREYDDKYQLYVDIVKELFPRKDVIFVNMFEEYKNFDKDKFFTFVSNGNDVVGISPGDIDFIHPNALGNAYIARVLLKNVFNISFNPEQYLREIHSGIMFPSY